eukprot:jgi/Ulvmu1/1586/UM111_0014.1
MMTPAERSLHSDFIEAAQEALQLKEGYKLRQPSAYCTHRYLFQVQSALRCISSSKVPACVGPVLWQILQNLRGANSQLRKLPATDITDPVKKGNIMVLMGASMFRNHVLFTVLAIAMVSDQNPDDLMEDVHGFLFPKLLQATRPSASMQQVQSTLAALEAAMASAIHGCNATSVQTRITELLVCMLALDNEGVKEVDRAAARTVSDVTYRIADADVRRSLNLLDTNFHQTANESQAGREAVAREVQEVVTAMASARAIPVDSMSTAGPAVLQELCHARTGSSEAAAWSAAHAGAAVIADRLLERLADGGAHVPACPITGLPYATNPPIDGGSACHAVRLHACGCCLSKVAADATVAASTCAVCRAPLPQGQTYQLSTAMLRVAQAHRARVLPAEATPDELTVEQRFFPVPTSARADGAVRHGTLRGEPVAVLQMHVGDAKPAHRACISHAIVATHLAATLSPLHCRIRGVCWEPECVSVAYDPEPFLGAPATAVVPAGPLTVADVVASKREGRPARQALEVVIDAAEAHATANAAAWSDGREPALGALTPDRVLVSPSRRICIADFRLLSRSCVPHAVAEAVRDRAPSDELPPAQSPHSERYLAPEAVRATEGTAVDASAMTVFSLGALLHFMVAGRHPTTATELESYGKMAPWAGSTRALTQSITSVNLKANAPPRTDEMRARMLDVRASARPVLAETTHTLMQELYTQVAQAPAGPGIADAAGDSAVEVVPAWDRTQPPPSAPCTVFRIPERRDGAPPPTFLPSIADAEPAAQPQQAPPPLAALPPHRNTYTSVPEDAPTAGVTAKLAADAPSPLQQFQSGQQHTGSHALAMSVCDTRSAAAPGGTTNSSWGQGDPLRSASTSFAGSGPVDRERGVGGYQGDSPHVALAAHAFVQAAGESAFAASGADPAAATERGSSAGVGADLASQASNGSNDPRTSGSMHGDLLRSPQQSARQSSMKRIQSWFTKGQPTSLQQLVELLHGKWNGCDCDLNGRHLKLSRSKSTSAPRNSLSSVDARSTSGGVPQLGWDVQIREQDINFQSPSFDARSIFTLAPRDSSAGAGTCFVGGKGTVLRELYLDLSVSGRLVFGPDCENITLRNMTIRDGTIICHGKSCAVRMESCALSGCSIIAADGAQLAVAANCDFGATRIALFAHGAGTAVTVESSGLRGCRQAACVAAGAHMQLTRCVVSGVTITGCEVRGPGSTLELHDCTVADAGSPSDYHWWIQGVWAHSGARAVVTRSTLMRMAAGALADGAGTTLELHEASCASNLACGAYIGYGAEGVFRDCDFLSVADSPPQNTGIEASGAGTAATVIGCRLRYNRSYGARVSDGGKLNSLKCQTEQNGMGGWCTEQGGVADLEGCKSVGERAYVVQPGATCRTVLCQPDVMG